MCQVTPREVIEKLVMEYRAEIAAEEEERKAKAEEAAREKQKTNPTQPATGPRRGARGDNRVKRCRAFLKKIPPSIEGEDGSDRMIQAARIIWNDFEIDEADGLPLLEEYNLSASPPWDAEGNQGYLRKWSEAVAKGPGPEGRGYRLKENRPGWEQREAVPTAPVGGDPDERKPTGAYKRSAGDLPDNPHRLGAELLGEGDVGRPYWLRFWKETFYEWTGAAYRKVSDSVIKAKVTAFARKKFVDAFKLQEAAYAADPDEGKKPPTVRPVNGELVGNVLNALRSLCLVPDEIEAPAWLDGCADNPDPRFLIAGPNGLLDLAAAAAGAGAELLAPDPDLFNLVEVGYRIEPHSPPPKLWLKFLTDLWPDDLESVHTLQEWFGYALSGETSFQKMLWLVGPSRAGKGVISYVLSQLVGAANVCTPSLYDFGTEFGLSSMLGKSLAIVGDGRLSNRADSIQVTARLLQIVGEDGIDVNRKNKAIVENTKLGVRIVVAANELPALVDNADAMLKRSLVLRLTKTFSGREDTALREKLKTELPSIMWWAVEGLANLRLRGRFSEPSSGAQLKQRFGSLLSPVGVFLQEKCVVAEGARVEKGELYRAWKAWCEEMGRKEPGTQEVFGRNLYASVSTLGEVRLQDPTDRSKRPRFYTGLRLRTLEEGDPHNDMSLDTEPGHNTHSRLFLDEELVA